MDLVRYLERIGFSGPLEPSPAVLCELHRCHLLAVPFENLDIHLRRPIVLDVAALYDKIVVRRRGGFCYELNGLFAALLRAAGFRVDLLAAGVAHRKGGFGPDYDHLLLRVENHWLADVGFGDCFLEPFPLEAGTHHSGGAEYRVDRHHGALTLLRRDPGADWLTQYRFSLQPRRLEEFSGMCLYHQTSPWTSFTQGRLCTRATPQGRVTLSDTRVIETAAGVRTERPVVSEQDFRATLQDRFGICYTAGC